MKITSATVNTLNYLDQRKSAPDDLTHTTQNCKDSSDISAAAKEIYAAAVPKSVSAPDEKHKSPFCIQFSDKDKLKILMLQALKRTLLGKKIKVKAPCCLEEWEKQLKEEDQAERNTGEGNKPCECSCCHSSRQVVDLLA